MIQPPDSTSTSQAQRVLLIEDDSEYAEMVANVLSINPKVQFEVIREARLSEGLARLGDEQIHLILLDMNLPDSVGIETLQKTLAAAPHLPIVVLTGHADENQAIAALHDGAQDYLIKGQSEVTLLSRAIRYAIERKRVLIALKESDARLRQIIEKNADPIIIIDHRFVIRFTNPAVSCFFGRNNDELLGSVFGFPLPQKGEASEIEIVDQKGRTIVAEMRVVPIHWEGEPGFLASLRDITDHKRMLVELEQTRRQDLQMKDVFLSKVSHELRSPLSVVHQFTTILLDQISGSINADQRDHLEIILRNVEELRKMIDDLLQVTRAEIDEIAAVAPKGIQEINVISECIPLKTSIHETLNMLRTIADRNSITLTAEVPENLPPVHADPQRINQVLNNLINNAIKFTPPNGFVKVLSQIYPEDETFVCVTVEDSGPGIPAEEKDKIFEYLYQLDSTIDDRRKGLGIGLYICREIVERHGGRIWVESYPLKGSRFHFTLPIFSLEKLLRPILTSDSIVHGKIGVITIEIFPAVRRSLTGEDTKVLGEVWGLLNMCVLPDSDLVMPRIGRFDNGEIFYIVACSPSDTNGIGALMRRIRAHLRQQSSLKEIGLNFTITATHIDVDAALKQQPHSMQLSEVVNAVKKIFNENLMRKRGLYVQEKDIACG